MGKLLAIVGAPRSGTTWVAKAIDSHPDTYYLHEPDSVVRMDIPQIVPEEEAQNFVPQLDTYLSNIESLDKLKVVGRLPFYEKSYLGRFDVAFNRFSAMIFKVLGRPFSSIGNASPPLVKPKSVHVTFFKSIESMGRISVFTKTNVPLKTLLLVRHPCAVISSELSGEEKGKLSSSVPVYEDWGLFRNLLMSDFAKLNELDLQMIQQMTPAERLAWRWLIYYQEMLRYSDNKNCLLVHYEYLCMEPTDAFAKVLSFFDLSFSQNISDYITETMSSHSDSYYATSKDPIRAMHGWKEKLGEENIAAVKRITGAYLSSEYWKV